MFKSRPSYYLSLYNVSTAWVSDAYGHTTSPIHLTGNLESVKGVSYDYPNSVSLMLTISTSDTYTVKFKSYGAAMDIQLLRGCGNVYPDLALSYKDLALPAAGAGMFRLTPQDVEPLRLDLDGDGNFETTAVPTAEGKAAPSKR